MFISGIFAFVIMLKYVKDTHNFLFLTEASHISLLLPSCLNQRSYCWDLEPQVQEGKINLKQ